MTTSKQITQNILDNAREIERLTAHILATSDIPITQEELDIASEHSYDCTCDLCAKWWEVMGPEPTDGPLEDMEPTL